MHGLSLALPACTGNVYINAPAITALMDSAYTFHKINLGGKKILTLGYFKVGPSCWSTYLELIVSQFTTDYSK